MKHPMMQKLAAVVAFVALTAVLLALCDFLLTDDIHSYSRVMLSELYEQAGEIDTLFIGSSHCYRSVDPDVVNRRLGSTALMRAPPSNCRMERIICCGRPVRRMN